MADTVRYLMEAMVPELEALELKGYFSKAELRAIAQQRTNYEYALKRKKALLQDFVKYAEYEMQLEELRRVRRKTRNITGKRSLADFCIARRVHFIFERATRKFRGNLPLWMAWLKHCRNTKSHVQFSKVVTKALRLHPCQPELWICAAAWEFDVSGNPTAARTLMQRGLRNCPDSVKLWAEYFEMELLYAAKLRARRAALGIHVDGDTGENVAGGGGNGGGNGVIQEVGGGDGGNGDDVNNNNNNNNDDNDNKNNNDDGDAEALVLRGGIASLVLQRVLEEQPDNINITEALLCVLWKRGWSWTLYMEQQLLQHIGLHHAHTAAGASLLARSVEESPFQHQHASLAVQIKTMCAVYEHTLEHHPSTVLYDAAIQFGATRLAALLEGSQECSPDSDNDIDAATTPTTKTKTAAAAAIAVGGQGDGGLTKSQRKVGILLQQWTAALCERACAQGMATNTVYAVRYELACRAAQQDTLPAIASAWVDAYPHSEQALVCRMQHINETHDTTNNNNNTRHTNLILACVLAAPTSASLWQAAAQLAITGTCNTHALQDLLCTTLIQYPPLTRTTPGMAAAVRCVVQATLYRGGAAAAHALCMRVLAGPPAPCGALLWMADLAADMAVNGGATWETVPGGQRFYGQHQHGGQRHGGHAALHGDDSTDNEDEDGGEETQGGTWDAPSQADALERKVLKQAEEVYGATTPAVWLRLMAAEHARGRGTGAVVHRALKVLQGRAVDEFAAAVGQEKGGVAGGLC